MLTYWKAMFPPLKNKKELKGNKMEHQELAEMTINNFLFSYFV